MVIMDKVTDVFTIVAAIVNIFLVYRVFKFTQKMSHSKLSLSPELVLAEDWSKSNQTNQDFKVFFAYREEGFPLEENHGKQEILFIRVKNRGDLPSMKIKIQMKLHIYKTEIVDSFTLRTGEDFIVNKRKLHEIRDIDITIDYMGADEERLFDIASLYGQVREVELVLIGIHANRHTYFESSEEDYLTSPTIVYHYKNPLLLSAWRSKDGGKSVYGHKEAWEEFERKRKDNAARLQRENEYYAERERENAEFIFELEQEEEKRRQLEEARFRGEIE